MKLSEILKQVGIEYSLMEMEDFEVSGISDNSQKVEPNYIFVAVKGNKVDGHLFISDAIEKGAKAIIAEQLPENFKGIVKIQVPDTRVILGRLAHAFYGYPSNKMKIVGVTGTNGKTTITFLIESVLKQAGHNPGVIGTIEYRYNNEKIDAPNTTPSPLVLSELMYKMEQSGIDYVVMEVSSHSIEQKRIEGIDFCLGVFTNLTPEHLDYHLNMQEYMRVKGLFFSQYVKKEECGIAVFNADDEAGIKYYENFERKKFSYSIDNDADYKAVNIEYGQKGIKFDIQYNDEIIHIDSSLIGKFNIYNMLAAYAACRAMWIDNEVIKVGLEKVDSVPGRFQSIDAGQDYNVVVDYAHTPDALSRVLTSARAICKGKLIAVFGCGGDRDKTKRYVMGKEAGDMADFAIITNDNPRSEDPEVIAKSIEGGVLDSSLNKENYKIILNRYDAIFYAINMARKDDLILIAGKGHEDYQIIGAQKMDFDDRLVAYEILKKMQAVGKNGE